MLDLLDLAALAAESPAALAAQVAQFQIGGKLFRFGEQPYLMGVINLSADSWYRESVCLSTEAAVERAALLHAQGAHLVDIGAESTLEQAARVDSAAQSSKLLSVIRQLRERNILASIETYHPQVARECLQAGAAVINLTGNTEAATIFQWVAEHQAAVIICYVQGANVREVGDFNFESDPIAQMHEYFARQIDMATRAGVRNILIDPGLGFYYRNLRDSAQRVNHQMRVFLNTFRLRSLGFPVCHALPHAFEYFKEDVRCAEPIFAVLAALGRTDLFRTHEISKTRAVLETLGAWKSARAPKQD